MTIFANLAEISQDLTCVSHETHPCILKILDGQVQASDRKNVSTLRPFKEGECLSMARHGDMDYLQNV